MSQNGVVIILETEGPEFRVLHVDSDGFYSSVERHMETNKDLAIKNVREVFSDEETVFFTNEDEAHAYVDKFLDDADESSVPIEYGSTHIKFDIKF